jgi:hypothetical protein
VQHRVYVLPGRLRGANRTGNPCHVSIDSSTYRLQTVTRSIACKLTRNDLVKVILPDLAAEPSYLECVLPDRRDVGIIPVRSGDSGELDPERRLLVPSVGESDRVRVNLLDMVQLRFSSQREQRPPKRSELLRRVHPPRDETRPLIGIVPGQDGHPLEPPLFPRLRRGLLDVITIDDGLERPSDRRAVLSIEGHAGVDDPLHVQLPQTFPPFLFPRGEIGAAAGQVEKLASLLFVQRVRPVGPGSGGGASRVHDNLAEGTFVLGPGVLQVSTYRVGSSGFSEELSMCGETKRGSASLLSTPCSADNDVQIDANSDVDTDDDQCNITKPPLTVTRSGSPPKAPIYCCTHSNAIA